MRRHGVTASLPERRVGVIGANGSGKSTLARLVNGVFTEESRRKYVRVRLAAGGQEV